MTSKSNHPLRQLLGEVASGYAPTDEDFDQISTGVHKDDALINEVKEAVKKVMQLREDGELGEARNAAWYLGYELAAKVPDYYVPSPNANEMDPQKLADLVPRS